MVVAPGLEDRTVVGPLADAWSRIDPEKDGWDSEAQSAVLSAKLKKLAKAMGTPSELAAWSPVLAEPVLEQLREDLSAFDAEQGIQAELKLYRIVPGAQRAEAQVIVHIVGKSGAERVQLNAEWKTHWDTADEAAPHLDRIEVVKEEILRFGKGGVRFEDATASVLGGTKAYREQLLRSTDHWRARIARDFGLDVVANHGMALGDVNGDGLDDLYLCQQGGLPNRLFVQEQDGRLRDITAESETGWLDYCASALILDFDNDGDRDLAVSQDFKILFMDNMGGAKFELALGLGTQAQTFSLAAADYDLDGDLDLFLCGYNPAADRGESGQLGEPMPYHDAQNGGKNMLLRNDGGWEFTDVTAEVGLDQNNNRFSFAASWIDFDQDGDSDLYVSNDYGRNNLYQNDGGSFRDVAAEKGVEDMSAGMSASWGDFNRDGAPDLYVSNMFSAAGNRITYQRQFKEGADENLLKGYQRHARGNSLFAGASGGGAFSDVSVEAGVTMGRWAWGSRFADLNNDGWEDLVVANGFISAPDTGDL